MAYKPNAQACANLAMDEVDGDFIPYVLGAETLDGRGADCQGLIEAVVRKLGGVLSVRGSNDMIRNFCDYVVPLNEAKLQPGCVLFIVRQDGNEPDRYKGDDIGNCSHVGWYTGGRYEVVHASASKGKVVPSTLKNGWTHAGWLSSVQYSLPQIHPPNEGGFPMMTAQVTAESGSSVRMRKLPSTGSIAIANVPIDTIVEVTGTRFEKNDAMWTPILYEGKAGYMMSNFLKPVDGVVLDDSPAPLTYDERVALLEKRVANIEQVTGIRYGG